MRPEGVPIQTLLWRTFTPAIVVVAIALGALVYTRLYDTILDGFSRKLITTSALTGALVDPADHDFLIKAATYGVAADLTEQTPQYLRNVTPMRRIRRELGLTYLYSQILGGTKDVVYVLDGTEGSEHSAIGSEDTLPAETRAGLRTATTRGTVYVSPIQFQEQWGLLKTAAAPMRGVDGRITATAGADVNIGVIHVATQNALFGSALIGIASLLACALVTIQIVRRVAVPIESLKADALRIAAGDRTPPARPWAPREVARLRDALAELAAELIGAMRSARAETVASNRLRNQRLLESVVGEAAGGRAVVLIDTPDRLVVWVGGEASGPQALMARRAMRLLAERIAERPAVAADVAALADSAYGVTLSLERTSRELRHMAGRPVILQAGEASQLLSLDEAVILRAGEALVVDHVPVAWEAAR